MSCYPNYEYVPDYFTPSDNTAFMPSYRKSRSRTTVSFESPLGVETGIFVRSVEQMTSANTISISFSSNVFKVMVDGNVAEQYDVRAGPGSFSALRQALSDSNLIEMPPFRMDIYDTVRAVEDDTVGMSSFSETFLKGGSGPPTTGPESVPVLTGPSRALVCIASYENERGVMQTPPAGERLLQWNGTNWISYTNGVQGNCPIDGHPSILQP